jgi:hypothetical protein
MFFHKSDFLSLPIQLSAASIRAAGGYTILRSLVNNNRATLIQKEYFLSNRCSSILKGGEMYEMRPGRYHSVLPLTSTLSFIFAFTKESIRI